MEEEKEEIFKDTFDSEEQTPINEFELKVSINNSNIDIDCVLTDLRFVFAVPTLQLLLDVALALQTMFEESEKEKLQERKIKLQTYEYVLSKLCSEFENDEELLLQRVLLNLSRKNNIDPQVGHIIYKEGLQKLYTIWDVKQSDKPIDTDEIQKQQEKAAEKAAESTYIAIIKKHHDSKNERIDKVKAKITIGAKLQNLSIWIPLQADNDRSQVFSLSFMSEFKYNQEANFENTMDTSLNEVIKKQPVDSSMLVGFSISQLIIQMIQSSDYMNLIASRRQSEFILAQQNDDYKSSIILQPSRIVLGVDISNKNLENYSKTAIKLNVEPLQLKIGFKHIDFGNIVLHQVLQSLEYVKEVQKKKNGDGEVKTSAEEVKELREEVKQEEKNLENNKCVDVKKIISFEKVNSQKKLKISITTVNIECDSITLALNEDSSHFADHPLIMAQIQRMQVQLQMFDGEDDAATYMLKKLGIWQKRNPLLARNQMYMNINFFTQLSVNYYNPRSLNFEPLMEPWHIIVAISQLAKYTEQNLKVQSEKILNINLTYGMALTLRRIMDRLKESYKNAEVYQKLQEGKEVSHDEKVMSKIWKKRLLSYKEKQEQIDAQIVKQHKPEYVFQNYTGYNMRTAIHDDMADEELEYRIALNDSPNQTRLSITSIDSDKNLVQLDDVMVFDGKLTTHSEKRSQDQLVEIQNEVTLRKNKNMEVESMEEDPLKIDIKLDGFSKISSVPIEGLGIYSYRTTFLGSETEKRRRFIPFLKKKENARTVGVICNVRMEGAYKKVSIESSVLIANNLKRPITIFVKNIKQDQYNILDFQRAIIEPDRVFRVPLSWILNTEQQALYIEAKAINYVILKNLDDLFTDYLEKSKLTDQDAQIIRLEHDYFCSMDIQSYKCLPKAVTNNPPQYVISFNPPVQISNYNFLPLEITDPYEDQYIYSMMGPKETAFINTIDGYTKKNPLKLTFYETQTKTLSTTLQSFDIKQRLQQVSLEKFTNGAPSKKDERFAKFAIEVKKFNYQYFTDYEENFEMRDRLSDYTASVQVMIYPKFMAINKTSMPFICGSINILPFTNDFLSVDNEKVSFKVPGYKSSQNFDINTVGLSGVMSLDLEAQELVIKEKLTQKEYIPKKIDFGITISQAPKPFSKTILVTIVPRYLFVNQLGVPIVLKQKGMKSQVILKGQQMPFNFEMGKGDKFIQMREPLNDELVSMSLGKGVYEDIANDERKFWSTPFSIDDIDDFQISYPRDIRKDEDIKGKWYVPNHDNNFLRFVRIIVSTQNEATILIVFTNPLYPEYEISNQTNKDIEIAQGYSESIMKSLKNMKKTSKEDLIIGEFLKVQPQVVVPFTWPSRLHDNRTLALKIGGVIQQINIDKATTSKVELKVTKDEIYNIEVKVTGNAKVINISNVEVVKLKQALFLQQLLKRYQGAQLNIGLDLKGVGLSFIDDTPEEILFLTLYEIKIQLQRWNESRDDGSGIMEQVTKLKLHLTHMQIDNMINQIMPVILAPTKPLNKSAENQNDSNMGEQKPMKAIKKAKEESKKGDPKSVMVASQPEEETPFIQLIVILAESHGTKEKVSQRRLRALQFAIQEFNFGLETSIINNNLKFVAEIVQILANEKSFKVILANTESFEKAKDQRREIVCEDLDPNKSLLEGSEDIQANKMFIELIHLGAIKANITFKLEKKQVRIDATDPSRGFGIGNIFYSVLAGVASISNSPLSFKELILIDTFAQPTTMVSQLQKNYTRQAIRQFYKLLGSSDMIGNPTGLVNKLGTGVYEFVKEPAQGLLRGPDEFVGGVGKGVQSLVTNVVSGGFESISKITGSLYTVVKNATGDKDANIQKPENLGQGLFQGAKGGVTELVGGVTGIFTKPVKKAKEEGAKGFFRGLGSGVVGAITAPVTATLAIGTSVTAGVSSTATNIGNIGKQQVDTKSLYARFRPPRYISTRNVISVYNEDMAQVSQILQDKYDGKYANQTIKFYTHLQYTKTNGEIVDQDDESSIMIITDQMLLYFSIEKEGPKKGRPHAIFKSRLRKIKKCEVYQTQPGNKNNMPSFVLVLTCYSQLKGLKKYQFQSNYYPRLEKIYTLLSVLPQCDSEDRVRNVQSSAAKVLEQVF